MPSVEIYPPESAPASFPELDLDSLLDLANQAVQLVLQTPPPPSPGPLAELLTVEVSLIDDAAIAEVHAQFLEDPTPTDVITFQHGEILVSWETAAREGPQHGQPFFNETLLYIVHGLLHLYGYEDTTAAEAATMAQLQTEICARLHRPAAL